MGQCLSTTFRAFSWPIGNPFRSQQSGEATTTSSSREHQRFSCIARSGSYEGRVGLIEEGYNHGSKPHNDRSAGQEVPKLSREQNRRQKLRIPGLFTLINRSRRQYTRQNDDLHGSNVELYDIVPPHTDSNPTAYYQRVRPGEHGTFSNGTHATSSNRPQPDLRQVAGIRQTVTCSFRGQNNYQQLSRQYPDGPVTLDPRRLRPSIFDGPHGSAGNAACAKWAPFGAQKGAAAQCGSMTSIESGGPCCKRHVNVIKGLKKGDSASSIDLEWENDESILQCPELDNVPSISVNETVDSCSVAIRSHASSQVSIPGLDWDSQGESADLVSLSNFEGNQPHPPLDLETEQLISEIELLTSRALRETNQWTSEPGEVEQNSNISNNNNNWQEAN